MSQDELQVRGRSNRGPDSDAVAQLLAARIDHPKEVVIDFCVDVSGRTREITGPTTRALKPWVSLYIDTIARWHFEPFEERGTPIPVCTHWTFHEPMSELAPP